MSMTTAQWVTQFLEQIARYITINWMTRHAALTGTIEGIGTDTLVGVGTNFINELAENDWIIIPDADGAGNPETYHVVSINSATSVQINQAATFAAQASSKFNQKLQVGAMDPDAGDRWIYINVEPGHVSRFGFGAEGDLRVVVQDLKFFDAKAEAGSLFQLFQEGWAFDTGTLHIAAMRNHSWPVDAGDHDGKRRFSFRVYFTGQDKI